MSLVLNHSERKALFLKWIGITMFMLHFWATVALWRMQDAIFNMSVWGIGITLIILVADRAADAVLDRFSPMVTTKTVTETVTPVDSTVKDVNIKAEGDINVAN